MLYVNGSYLTATIGGAGIPETLLLGQLDVVSPQNARDLLTMLTVRGLLHVRAYHVPVRSGPPPIFGSASSEPSQQVRRRLLLCHVTHWHVACHMANFGCTF